MSYICAGARKAGRGYSPLHGEMSPQATKGTDLVKVPAATIWSFESAEKFKNGAVSRRTRLLQPLSQLR